MSNHRARSQSYVLDEPGANVLLDLFVLDQQVGTLLRTALLAEGVSPAHYAVLAQVGRGITTPGKLSERLSLSPGTLTGYLDALEKRSLLQRSRSATDGRSVHLSLTESGEQKRAACQAVMGDVVRRLDRALGGAGARNEVRATLGRLGEALDDLSEALR